MAKNNIMQILQNPDHYNFWLLFIIKNNHTKILRLKH